MRFRGIFTYNDYVIVPEVIHELTAGGVLSMSFEAGAKINDLEAVLGPLADRPRHSRSGGKSAAAT